MVNFHVFDSVWVILIFESIRVNIKKVIGQLVKKDRAEPIFFLRPMGWWVQQAQCKGLTGPG